ncbi:MAG: hypothetical protein QM777_06315 [Pseudorhodoferax sp.]
MERPAQAVALFDERPFFEKALQHGVRHGILVPEKLAAMCQEAPKGMVQIARYFGTEYLRPDLELARTRLVNLVSLYLEDSCAGDLDRAAQSLRDHSLLSRSKGGSDMLKALIVMPQSSHFGMQEQRTFEDRHIPLLARWSLRSLTEVQAERAARGHAAALVEAAVWMAAQLGLDADDLQDAGKDAEAVLRTALLVRAVPAQRHAGLAGLREDGAGPAQEVRAGAAGAPRPAPGPAAAVRGGGAVRAGVRRAGPAPHPRRPDRRAQAVRPDPAFLGRYFWSEDALAELEHFERSNSALWDKATEGHGDDSSLLTLFLRIATGGRHATMISERTALALVKKVQKSGLDAELPRRFIAQHAPVDLRADYLQLWNAFIAEAEPALRSDQVHATADALALLRRECNIGG